MRPIDRLNKWISENQAFFRQWSYDYAHNFNGDRERCDMMIREQIKLWRNWTADPKNHSAVKNRRAWGKAWSFWWKEFLKRHAYVMANMTYQQEQAYYASKKRWTGTSEMERLDD